jgi:hypothetical protein
MRPQQAVRSSLRRVDAGRTLPRAVDPHLGNVTTDRTLKPRSHAQTAAGPWLPTGRPVVPNEVTIRRYLKARGILVLNDV